MFRVPREAEEESQIEDLGSIAGKHTQLEFGDRKKTLEPLEIYATRMVNVLLSILKGPFGFLFLPPAWRDVPLSKPPEQKKPL